MDREFINEVTLQGVVGNSQVHEYAPGMLLNRFSLLTQREEKTCEGVPVVSSTWHNCIAHNRPGIEDPRLITKGTYVRLTGSMRNVGYIQPPANIPCVRTEISVKTLRILEQ